MLETPVVVCIYNRPEKVKQLMTTVRAVRPMKVLLIADGPKARSADDLERTSDAQREFRNSIDWPCEVLENVSQTNLGLRERISSGLTWAFDHVPEAIILEDDCLPHPDFFTFCEQMLNDFRNDDSIGLISGSSFLPPDLNLSGDFYVSNFVNIWGWAAWSRTFEDYDASLKSWPKDQDFVFQSAGITRLRARLYWRLAFSETKRSKIDTWDYQLVHLLWKRSQKTIVPTRNLIVNTGFGLDSTNTIFGASSRVDFSDRLSFPALRPQIMDVDPRIDSQISKLNFEISTLSYISKTLYFRLPSWARNVLGRILRYLVGRSSLHVDSHNAGAQ